MNLKNIIKISIMVLFVASFSIAPANADIFSWVKSNIRTMQIVSWAGSQPIVVQANGVYYDTYLTNTYYPDCGQSFVVELYTRGSNRNMAPDLAHQCIDADAGNGASRLSSAGQQLANNYQAALQPTSTPSPTPLPTIIPTPIPALTTIPKPQLLPLSISRQLESIWAAFTGLFGLSIAGGASISTPVNQPYTTPISLTFSVPDINYSDGSYTAKFGEWFVTDSNKNILKESGWSQELIISPYTASAIFTPTVAGKYYLIGVVVNQQYTYANNAWTVLESIETKEVQEIVSVSGAPKVATTQPSTSNTSILANLSAWLKNIFSFLPW